MQAAISLMLVIPSTTSIATEVILLLTIMLQSSAAGKILCKHFLKDMSRLKYTNVEIERREYHIFVL